MPKKIIAVLGATGSQGGGLAKSICADSSGEFTARALTRKVDSEKARELAALGAEVVACNVDEESSLRAAFEGVHGVYGVTFFWDHFSPEKENQQAAAIAGAAKAANVHHVVWSTLEDSRKFIALDDPRMPTLMGKYKVPHFDAKGESDIYFENVPTTYLLTSFYWDNLYTFGMGPKRGTNGKLVFALPIGDAKFPQIASEDIGRCAHGIFRKGDSLINKRVGVAGQHLTGVEMAESLTKAFGEEVSYYSPSFDAYRGFGFPGAEDLGNMFQFNHDFADAFCFARDLEYSRELNPELQTFDEWLAKNRAKITID
ncbi:MAG: NmrA/HSCARG family protein [Acidobacteriota bacterium]